MHYSEIQELIEKYLNGRATESEIKFVDAWYSSFDTVTGLTSELSEGQINDMQTKGLSAILNQLALVKK